MQITIHYDSVYIHDGNANNYSPGGVENVRQSHYTHAPDTCLSDVCKGADTKAIPTIPTV